MDSKYYQALSLYWFLTSNICDFLSPYYKVNYLHLPQKLNGFWRYSWFTTTWQGGHVGGQCNTCTLFWKNLQENGGKFPEERNAFVLSHQNGHHDITCKPARFHSRLSSVVPWKIISGRYWPFSHFHWGPSTFYWHFIWFSQPYESTV